MQAQRLQPPGCPTTRGRPEGSRCVWMTAGVLDYWLCPRQLDCEHCLLDRVLSGRAPTLLAMAQLEAGEVVPHTGHATRLEHLAVPLRRRRGLWYHPTHVWGRAFDSGRIRLGLDDITARLLAESEPWSLPEIGAWVARRDALGHTRVNGALVHVGSPLPGRVVARNGLLRRHPKLATWSPYDAGWLVELESDVRLGAAAGFMDDDGVVSRWFDREVQRLAGCALEGQSGDGELGETLADGGAPSAELRALLGDSGHRTALCTFFPFGG